MYPRRRERPETAPAGKRGDRCRERARAVSTREEKRLSLGGKRGGAIIAGEERKEERDSSCRRREGRQRQAAGEKKGGRGWKDSYQGEWARLFQAMRAVL